jgi:glycosyltransferase involved in cell wall biosynthesis
MKILMLTPYLPYPPASGGQIRTYNLLKHLSKSHEITLVCLYKREEERQYAQELKSYCKDIYLCKRPEKPWQLSTILKAIFGVLPFLIVRNYSREAAKTVRKLLAKRIFDVIHAETFYVMPHIPETKIPTILVDQTLEYRVYKHFITQLPWFLHHPLRLDTFKLKYWEEYYWNHAQLVAAVSETDAKAIHMLAPNIDPVVIPNGASDDMFVDNPVPKNSQDSINLLFVGNFSWLQNTEAAQYLIDKVLPLLQNRLQNYRLTIAGQKIPERFRILSNPYIDFIDLEGSDNETVRGIYTDASLFIAPIFGPGGTRLKILTAMATHLPVITTSTGAEGLYLVHNESVMLAENPEEFAQNIVTLAGDSTLSKKIADNAYAIARKSFSWESITKTLVESYQSITKR